MLIALVLLKGIFAFPNSCAPNDRVSAAARSSFRFQWKPHLRAPGPVYLLDQHHVANDRANWNLALCSYCKLSGDVVKVHLIFCVGDGKVGHDLLKLATIWRRLRIPLDDTFGQTAKRRVLDWSEVEDPWEPPDLREFGMKLRETREQFTERSNDVG